MRTKLLVGFLLLAPAFAGCFGGGPEPSPSPEPTSPPTLVIQDGLAYSLASAESNPDIRLQAWAAAGAVSRFTLNSAHMLRIPANVVLVRDGVLSQGGEFEAQPGKEFQLLIPPGMTNLTLDVVSPEDMIVVPTPDTGTHLFNGGNIVEWYKVQRDQYPDRCAGCPNYAPAQEYFAALFRSFGLAAVEVDPYGSNPVHPEFANVVGYRYPKTDADHLTWVGVGGHYDVVPETTEGAFDNTAGTLATLELARVLGQFKTYNNVVFGLWGGEESGLQGSAFFTRTNPNVGAQMRAYVNLDVSAFSWPAPRPVGPDEGMPDCSKRPPHDPTADFFCPDPVLVSAGPDGPVADSLLALARQIQKETVAFPDEYFIYEPVGGGQLQGYAGVNAQSDHTSFIAAGVPSYFLFNGDALNTPIGIHNEADKFDNWLRYVYHNMPADLDGDLAPEEEAEAEAWMARSFETYLWLTFYIFLALDAGPQPV